MKVLVVHDKPRFAPQIAYAFEVLLSSLGLSQKVIAWPSEDLRESITQSDAVILYGSEALSTIPARHKLHIHNSSLFGSGYMTDGSLPALPLDWFAVDGKRLPVLYRASSPLRGQPVLAATNGRVLATRSHEEADSLHTNLDLVASSFFMLSRYEEVLSRERDWLDRFPIEANLSYRQGFWRIPIVSLYARLLGDWISSLIGDSLVPGAPAYPKGCPFGLCLTHDIDHSRKFSGLGLPKTVAKVILGREHHSALRQIGGYLTTGQDPYWNFERIIDWELKHGFRSTFFVAAGRRHRRDPRYGDDPKERAKLCQTILALGGELGLHGSLKSYLSADVLGRELALMRRHSTVIGGRQHYLRLDAQRSLTIMERVGLLYDCTLGFSDEMGFRSGFAGPHRMFNLVENRPFGVLEIPLLIMDRSIWSTCCQGMSTEDIWEEMLPILEHVRDCHGCASVLWHNSFFDEAAYPGYGRLYQLVLSWLQENNGWGASAGQVHEWFRANRGQP